MLGFVPQPSLPYWLPLTGQFAREFILENQAGAPVLKAMRRTGREPPIEPIGRKLREMMPWINSNRLVDRSGN